MDGILLDPSFRILVEAFAPAIATPLRIDGMFQRDGKAQFFANDIAVPQFNGAITQLEIPAYSEHLTSLSCNIPAAAGPDQGVFVNVSLIHGLTVNLRKVASLCSGWVYQSNPVGFPMSNRIDNPKVLAPLVSVPGAALPGADVIYQPIAGLNAELVGFFGTFTADVNVANRQIGLETLDTGGNVIVRNLNTNVIPALAVQNLIYAGNDPIDLTIGADSYVGGMNVPVRDPMLIQTNTVNLQVGDTWTNVIFLVRPNIIL